MRIRDRVRRLDNNPASGGIAWLATHVTAPIATAGGIVMIVVGLIELGTGGNAAAPLLGMGGAWLAIGLFLLPPAFWRRLKGER